MTEWLGMMSARLVADLLVAVLIYAWWRYWWQPRHTRRRLDLTSKFVIGNYGPGPADVYFVDQVRRDGTLTNPVFEGTFEQCKQYIDHAQADLKMW